MASAIVEIPKDIPTPPPGTVFVANKNNVLHDYVVNRTLKILSLRILLVLYCVLNFIWSLTGVAVTVSMIFYIRGTEQCNYMYWFSTNIACHVAQLAILLTISLVLLVFECQDRWYKSFMDRMPAVLLVKTAVDMIYIALSLYGNFTNQECYISTGIIDKFSPIMTYGLICMTAATILLMLFVILGVWIRAKTNGREFIKYQEMNTGHTIYYSPVPMGTQECSICLTDFVGGQELTMINGCWHKFHPMCYTQWAKINVSCPNCRHVQN
jgi:hypothetical protein